MSLVPFHLTLASSPGHPAHVERFLADWARETHGPTGTVVRWAIVGGPPPGQAGPWQIAGVAGPLPLGEPAGRPASRG
jgi:hypothetical protein